MGTVANIVAVSLLALAISVVLANGLSVYVNARNRRRGIERHVSGIPLVAQVLVVLAAMALGVAAGPWLPSWLLWAVALSDAALWRLVGMLLLRARRRS